MSAESDTSEEVFIKKLVTLAQKSDTIRSLGERALGSARKDRSMRTVKIPNTRLEVSCLCLGTAYYGDPTESYVDSNTSMRLLDTFYEA